MIGIERLRTNLITRGEVMKRFKKIVWKIWVNFLVLSIPVSAITFLVSICCLNTETIKPAIICFISGSWLLWLIICNTPDENNKRRECKDETRDNKDHVA